MSVKEATPEAVHQAKEQLDAHFLEIIKWHFSPETGTPYWLDWANEQGWNPIDEMKSFDDVTRFPHFDDSTLVKDPHSKWVPNAYKGKPFKVFETGGTTGLPKQRISWEDHLHDYSEYSNTLDDTYFPKGGNWLMLGPTGPRRLRLAIEHLANVRGGICYHVDLDPRYVKKLLRDKKVKEANEYKEHCIDQAMAVIRNRDVHCLFSTPKMIEALGERISIPGAGITGIFSGGTSMTTQEIRFMVEEVLENKTQFVPTYGNTLMGLACSVGLTKENNYELTYYAPQPRAVLRMTDPNEPDKTVAYGEWGRVELTTLTKEFFMPRFLERDEAIRRKPCDQYPWEGVGEVRPFGMSEKKIIEGVY